MFHFVFTAFGLDACAFFSLNTSHYLSTMLSPACAVVLLPVPQSKDEAGTRVMGFLVGEKNLEGQVPGAFIVAPGDDGEAIKYRCVAEAGELVIVVSP